ncbi:hypothetical protein QA649_21550 [Bradyrhizobium sp. CB1717]|uniref:hypothetical protein n=1 Tax=Bradyrhizobium sp. CB1717 TaxID=3039154 RepID=UPI0024B064BB|nr:hypothetical protein [Bradyrhizobium sp. CB1717]WFU28707.1 hypothetical protein QA649_21550 [Bradyrhizobium sp. CB1717]
MSSLINTVRSTSEASLRLLAATIRPLIRWLHVVVASIAVLALSLMLLDSLVNTSSKASTAVAAIAIAILVLLIFGEVARRAHAARLEKRLDQISDALQTDPFRKLRAHELLTCAKMHSRRAQFNSVSSMVVLALLALFVAFAGAALNFDAVKLGSLSQVKEELDARRSFFTNNSFTMTDSDKKDALDQIGRLGQRQDELVGKQSEAEQRVLDPTNRIMTALLVRIAVVAVSIYLVIILNRAYKQHTAMSALYRSRLVALLRGDDDLETFAKYAVLVSADMVEYKTDIDSPIDQIAGALEKLAKAFRGSPKDSGSTSSN